MKRLLSILSFLASLTTFAKVVYLRSDGGVIPRNESIIAAEARVALEAGRIGSNASSSWSFILDSDTITISFNNSNFVDGIDRPKARVCGPGFSEIVYDTFDYSGQPNTLAIEWDSNGLASVYGGHDQLHLITQTSTLKPPTNSVRVSSAHPIEVIDLLVETNPNAFARLKTDISPEDMENATLWRYIDRQNDPKIAVAGGKYTLAAIPNPTGFDLIYVDGAVTNASHWETGMLKGRLVKTGFQGYYKLEWMDATGRKVPGEHYAETADAILTLHFPELQCVLRFAR